MTTQANREVVAPISPRMGMAAIRARDFTMINPPEFHGLKVEEDPQEFINEVYKVVEIMGITLVEKAKLAAYQLKGVAQVWFNQWNKKREIDVVLLIRRSLRYAPTMVVDPKARMSEFMSDASDLMVKECLAAMLVKDMDVSRLMVHSQ
ncbi:hypothetical protein MTR67_052459 [Solanum verrucosum]|uniref:Gag-pol polyprotein n=1 Tax=Solanum verrucosum TaxID=315347 RepID=A0AAF1A3J2_SOLVR|nr:hypothetical protein MTR67_052459 [Solanum verrucosum]